MQSPHVCISLIFIFLRFSPETSMRSLFSNIAISSLATWAEASCEEAGMLPLLVHCTGLDMIEKGLPPVECDPHIELVIISAFHPCFAIRLCMHVLIARSVSPSFPGLSSVVCLLSCVVFVLFCVFVLCW